MKFPHYFTIFFLVSVFFKTDAQITNISGVINNYAAVTNMFSQSVAVSSSTGFSSGDKVLLIQMKGATIDLTNSFNFGTITSYNDAGNYEILTISAISSTSITFTSPFLRTYNTSGLVQIVKIPTYNNVNVTGVLTCLPWNGLTGGILAFEATGNITLNANIDITGKGFLGGAKTFGQFFSCSGNTTGYKLSNTSLASSNKGEGIVVMNSSFAKGLGALANGGGAGNDVNGGGAGGGNYGEGGHGGNSKCSSSPVSLCGGSAGKNCTYSNVNNKIFLGGGGGAGHENDGASTAGVSGGGIVLIRCGGSIVGNGNFINANGNSNTLLSGNDGQGGGGAGGTVLIDACSASSLNISVKGGKGGEDNFSGPDCHGKGGGGGGGVIWTSSTSLNYAPFLNGGNPGVFTNSFSQCFNASNGATVGQVGGTLTGLLIPGSIPMVSGTSFSLTTTNTNNLCFNNSTASASVTASGLGPYTYLWSPGGYTTASVSNLSAGVYTVNVNSGVCSSKSQTIVITEPSQINVGLQNSSICNGESTIITPTIAGGTPTYTLLWLPSNLNTSAISVSPNVTTNYSLVVNDANGCSFTASQITTVNQQPMLTVLGNTTICLGSNASTTIAASGTDVYTWINSSSLSSSTGSVVIASPSMATTYTVLGTNTLTTCSNTATVRVSVYLTPTITAIVVNNTSCGLSNGSATISSLPASNTYAWSSGAVSTTNIAHSINAGSYSVTAINGSCQTTTVVNVLSSAPLLITSSIVIPTNCNVNNGSITVTDNLVGTNYFWNPNISTTNTITNLASGNYSLMLANSTCSTSAIFSVGLISGPTSLNVLTNNAICESTNGGITVINVVNGVSPYLYSFNNSAFSSIQTFSNLAQGSYSLIVKDVNECVYLSIISIGKDINQSVINLTTNTPNCLENDGAFIINSITGGTPPYLTSLNNMPFTPNMIFESLSSGNYFISIKDSNNCKTNYNLTMPENNGDYTLYIPNAFSPNNDSVNDIWYIQGTCLGAFTCLIYNRWGEKIIELNDIKRGWNGTYKGALVPDGVYVYVIEIETRKGIVNKAGHITLLGKN